MQHKASLAVIGIFLLLLLAGSAAADTGKTVYLDLPKTPITVGESVQIPVIITGVSRLDLVSLDFQTESAYVRDFIVEKGSLDADDYSIGSFRDDGSVTVMWPEIPGSSSSYSGSGPVTFVVLNFTPHTSGNIPLTIIVSDINEHTGGNTASQFSVNDGHIPVVGGASIKVADDIIAHVGKKTSIPVTISDAYQVRIAHVQVTITTGANGIIKLREGDVSITDFIPSHPSVDNSYVGSVLLMSGGTGFSGDGILFYLDVTPDTASDISVYLKVLEVKEEHGSQTIGQNEVDMTDKYAALGAMIHVIGSDPDPESYLNLVSDNTVPPAKWSAETPARIIYNASTEERKMAPPQITWGGKSIPLNETLIVEELSSTGTVLKATTIKNPPMVDNRNVTIPAATTADAVELRITFEGRCLGDVDGIGGVTLSDAQIILDYRFMIRDLNPTEYFYANVDEVGDVTLSDAQKILDYRFMIINEHYR